MVKLTNTTRRLENAGPKAMSRVLDLFSTLAQAPEGLSLADLSAALEAPKSTLIGTLRPLVTDDYLVMNGALYRLGPRAFRLAAEISSAWSLPRIVGSYMRNLSEQTGESVGLAVLDRDMRRFVYVDVIESTRPVRYTMRLGMGGHLHATAAGRVLLAHQSDEFQDNYLRNADLTALTARTVTDRDALRAQLAQVRRDGCWISIGESIADSAAIAAPVFGPDGAIIAALSIGAPSERLTTNVDDIRLVLMEAAAHASGQFGGE